MDQAYKYMISTYLTLNNTKDIITIFTKNEEIKFGGTKITSPNINARKKVLVHSLLERKKGIRGDSLGY